jgi:3'-5' exoribonuclease
MPRRFVNQFGPGEKMEDQIFLIAAKDLRTTSQGSLYIHAVLTDRTGQIPGRMWQANEAIYKSMPEGGFLAFNGRTESYKGSLQFIIDGIRIVEEGSVDLGDFLPKTDQDIDAMYKRTLEILKTIKQKDLKALVEAFVKDRSIMDRFKTAPAAVQHHHAFIGGLLEHTVSLLELALVVIPKYPKLSLDLVLSAIFLHDIGKTAELTYDTNFKYSTEGQLVGHIAKACLWVEQKCDGLAAASKPIDEDVRVAVLHMILSHHGTREFGSPVLPAMPEAIALHHLDNLDAKVHTFLREIENDSDDQSDWTQYIRSLETRILKKDMFGTRGNTH